MLIIKGVTSAQQEQMENVILYPDTTFDNNPANSLWVNSEFGRKVIQDIEGIDVSDTSKSVESVLLQQGMLVNDLATGSKNLMLCKFYQSRHCPILYNRLGRMGENCFKWLLQIALEKDVRMTTTVFRLFKESDMSGAIVYFEDLDRKATTAEEVNDGLAELGNRKLLQA